MTLPVAMLPFIPGGSNFARSRELFLALGAEELWGHEGVVGIRWGGTRFILQDYNVTSFAENLMLVLEVPDLDAWWAEAEGKRLPERFPGFRINAPKELPWGREVHFIDLAGVCWHVRNA